jgi:hypothetical protein
MQPDHRSYPETLSGRKQGEGKVGGEASNMAPGASSSISTPLWSRDKAQDLYPNSCLPFFLPGI